MAILMIGILHLLGNIYSTLEKEQGPLTNLVAEKELPDVALQTLDGKHETIAHFRGQKTAFVLVGPDCYHCDDFLARIAENNIHANPEIPRIVILSLGNISQTENLINKHRLDGLYSVLIDTKGKLKEKWGVKGTPTTVLVQDQETFSGVLKCGS